MKKKGNKVSEQVDKEVKKNSGGRPKIAQDIKRGNKVWMYLSDEERFKFEKAYKEILLIEKMSRNSFIIDCVLSVIESSSERTVKPSTVRTTDKKIYTTLLENLSANTQELNTIGVNLNQLVKQTYFLNLTALSKKEIEKGIKELLPKITTLVESNLLSYQFLKNGSLEGKEEPNGESDKKAQL